MDRQMVAVVLVAVPIAILGASIYYKNGSRSHGLFVGLMIALTTLMLDALITVPLTELPKGVTYGDFFSVPFLWYLVSLNITTVFVLARKKIGKSLTN